MDPSLSNSYEQVEPSLVCFSNDWNSIEPHQPSGGNAPREPHEFVCIFPWMWFELNVKIKHQNE